jgi:flagellar basal-body rod protein FlgG
MGDGLQSAASGLEAQQYRMDSLANDIANVNTPGYRRDRVAFRDLAYDGGVGSGAAADSAGRSQIAGALQQTGQPLDLAIDGSGYLQVKTADGRTALTRVGSLHIDANGSLVTGDGLQLVPPVTLPKGATEDSVAIAADGTVTVHGQKAGQIGLVDVTAESNLQPLGEGLYLPTTASGAPTAAKGAQLRQGYLEASDVDIATAMVDMIEAQRAFAMASQAVKTQDQLLEIANGLRH